MALCPAHAGTGATGEKNLWTEGTLHLTFILLAISTMESKELQCIPAVDMGEIDEFTGCVWIEIGCRCGCAPRKT